MEAPIDMKSRHIWRLREVLKEIWVRVVGIALLAVLAAGLARLVAPFLPEDLAPRIGEEAVAQLLEILTSSMLVVTTFSLSVAVAAFTAAARSATPRATILLQQDRTTQNVLATFLGAFLFGLVGLIALHAKFYDSAGQVMLFFFAIAVIGLVIIALIRWIDHLMKFGLMNDTLDRVEQAASAALAQRLDDPYLGGQPLTDPRPGTHLEVCAEETGYVQHIDMKALQSCAERADINLQVRCLPGAFVARSTALLAVESTIIDNDEEAAIRRAFTIGSNRTFEDDPRFGLIVLTEIASKALSPAVNDPGTAINILGRLTRVLSLWRQRTDVDVRFDRVYVPPIAPHEAIEDAFRAISRDGAPLVEVPVRLFKSLASLCNVAPEAFSGPCADMVQEAMERCETAGLPHSDMILIRAAAEDVTMGSNASETAGSRSIGDDSRI